MSVHKWLSRVPQCDHWLVTRFLYWFSFACAGCWGSDMLSLLHFQGDTARCCGLQRFSVAFGSSYSRPELVVLYSICQNQQLADRALNWKHCGANFTTFLNYTLLVLMHSLYCGYREMSVFDLSFLPWLVNDNAWHVVATTWLYQWLGFGSEPPITRLLQCSPMLALLPQDFTALKVSEAG